MIKAVTPIWKHFFKCRLKLVKNISYFIIFKHDQISDDKITTKDQKWVK